MPYAELRLAESAVSPSTTRFFLVALLLLSVLLCCVVVVQRVVQYHGPPTASPITMVRVRVLFFARAREITQTNEADLDLDLDADDVQWRGSLDDFIGKLEETYRSLAEIRGAYTLAVNQEYIDRGERLVLREGDEVALITPISGG